jgi:hypothetical protein
MQLPKLLNEAQIRPFNYYWQGEVRCGMWTHGHLYALFDCFEAGERTRAFEKGCCLAEKGDIVLTVSNTPPAQYRLWIALSNQTDIPWLVKTASFAADSSMDVVAI